MYDGSQGNAMTEIALALAMGFFSLLVLALVSMGAGREADSATTAAVLAPPVSEAAEQGATDVDPRDVILVYHNGGFLDSKLQAVDPGALDQARRVVLAFAPDVPLAEAMSARSRVKSERLVVSTLDEAWLAALARYDATGGARP
ncbi:MAG: hypothetical protein QNJ67_21100 [Kiloniellales bacterium]|nr:hypothetical protein [Kiloniellales bacterium]